MKNSLGKKFPGILKPFLVIFIIPLLLVVIWFRNGNILGHGESGLPFYDFKMQLNVTRDAWFDFALGLPTNIITASMPIYWLSSIFQNVGVTGYLLQASFFWLIFVVSGLSIYFLIKLLFPLVENKLCLLAVFFYWFNPLSLVNVWNRFLNNYMFFWALLPLALYLYLKGIRERKLIYSVIVSLVCGIFSYALTSVPFNIILWGVFTYTSIFYLFFSKTKSERIFILSYFFATLASFVLINFWWISQLFAFVISPQIKTVTSEFFKINDNLSTLSTLSNLLGKLINTSRLLHGTFSSYSNLWWTKVYDIWPLSILPFLPIGIVFWTIHEYRYKKEVLYLGLLLFVSLFLVKGSAPPFGEIYEWGFIRITLLQVFRNPFEKFGFLLPLAIASLFVYGLQELESKYKRLGRLLILLSWPLAIGLYGFPFLIGLVFTSSEGKDRKIQSYEVKVPDYYKNVNDWLNKQPGQFRFISLPLNDEGITYTWPKPYSGVELSSAIFDTPNISFNTTIPYYNQIISQVEKYQLNENILRFVPFINTKYIVLRKDVDFKVRRMANPEVVERKLGEWVKKGFIEKKYTSGQFLVYEIANRWFWPKIYTTTNMFISNSADLAEISKIDSNFPQEKQVILDSRRTLGKVNIDVDFILGSEKIIPSQQTLNLQDFSDEDLMARLFYVKYLPNKWFYLFLRIKEFLLTPSKSDYSAWVLYKTGILGKRAVEIYKLKSVGEKEKTIERAEGDYLKNLHESSVMLSGIVKSSGPVAEVVKESLLYQHELLKRAKSDVYPKLSDQLLELKLKPKFDIPISNFTDYMIYIFNVPKSGRYKISFDRKLNTDDLFINGKNLSETDDFIFLESGIQEIAIPNDWSQSNQILISEENLEFNNKTKLERKVNDVEAFDKYRIKFDYRFKEGKAFGILFLQDIDSEDQPVFSSQIKKDDFYHEWKHWEGEIDSSVGADAGILKLFSPTNKVCKKVFWIKYGCLYETLKFDVSIKNFKVSRIKQPNIYLVSQGGLVDKSDTSTNFVKFDPTHYEVTVNKKNAFSEMLVFSELFDSGWEAVYENGEKIPDNKHFLVNVYANGWLLDKIGDYKITLKFSSQSLLEKSKKISIISVVIGVFILLIAFIWLKRKR